VAAETPTHEVVLVRHAETEWSLAGRHTGRTDVLLSEAGRLRALALGRALAGRRFSLVLTSPLSRAAETCRLAGFEAARQRDDLLEWDYGDYEGRTTAEIRRERPGWSIWEEGVPGGETIGEVGARVDRIIGELRSAGGDAVVFAHGHVLRVLAARWFGLEPSAGKLFALDPGTISTLGYEHGYAVLRSWNQRCLVQP
jgi:broad specificity phosphatase PhoE